MSDDYVGFCRHMALNYLTHAGKRKEQVTDERLALLVDLKEAAHYLAKAIAALDG